MWFFSQPKEKPKVIHASDRKKCWSARDTFFRCLDAHQIVDAIKDDSKVRKVCSLEIEEFEQACVGVWVEYFKQKRTADHIKDQRIKELEKAGYKPLNAPLQVKSITEEEAPPAR